MSITITNKPLSLSLMLQTIDTEYKNLSVFEKKIKIKEIFGQDVKTAEIENYYNVYENLENESKLQETWLLL